MTGDKKTLEIVIRVIDPSIIKDPQKTIYAKEVFDIVLNRLMPMFKKNYFEASVEAGGELTHDVILRCEYSEVDETEAYVYTQGLMISGYFVQFNNVSVFLR